MNIFKDLQTDEIQGYFEFTSNYQNINFAETVLNEISEKRFISEELFGNILLSVSEAINNAIVHGNKFNPKKKVVVQYSLTSNILVISVIDEGQGFDVNLVEDPTQEGNIEKLYGRGVFIILNLCDKVEFEFQKGQIVRMSFNL
jgi:serine/threonine-protein kinase RsbW